MPTFLLLIAVLALVTSSCGVDKRFPSSNPPEYDPNKVYTTPTAPTSLPAAPPVKPVNPELPPIRLPSLEPGPNERGEWRKVPITPEVLQPLKGTKTPCEVLSRLVQGLGSTQLFSDTEGKALKKSLGSQAEAIARTLDQQLTETFKKQLGPGAADCPSPSPPRNSSSLNDFSQPARIVRTSGASNAPILLAQSTAPQAFDDGYSVTKMQQVQEAPPGWVGRKTTDRVTRVGNKPETTGRRESFDMVMGPKVLKCPSPDGLVPGEFGYTVVFDQTIDESGEIRMTHYGQRVDATLKGQVGDDAKLQYVDVGASIVIERGGTNTPASVRRIRMQARFTPDREVGGIPTEISNISATAWDSEEAHAKDNETAGTLLVLAMFFSGTSYMQAEAEWSKPNTCVEIIFTPATKHHKLDPNQSVKVQTEVRTKKEQTVVPAKFLEAREMPKEGNGKVSPTQEEANPGAPATFTYRAPPKRVRHSGFKVGALSRAGTADAEWEVAADLSYLLEFDSTITYENPGVGGSKSHAYAAVELRPERLWLGTMQYETVPTNPSPLPCVIQRYGNGTTTFLVTGSISAEPFAVNLMITPGDTKDTKVFVRDCPGNTPESLEMRQPIPFWSFVFGQSWLQRSRQVKPYRVSDWTPVLNSDVVARKTIKFNYRLGDQLSQEETIFTLRQVIDKTQ